MFGIAPPLWAGGGAVVAAATPGPIYTSASGRIDVPRVVALDATRAIATFWDNLTDISGRVLTITGTAVSFGTKYGLTGGVDARQGDIERLSTDKCIMVYQNAAGSNVYARVVSVAGTVLSVGAEATVSASGGSSQAVVVALNATEAIAVFNDFGVVKAALLTITGTSIAVGAPQTCTGLVAQVNGRKGVGKTSASAAVVAGNASGSFQAVAGLSVAAGVLSAGSAQVNNIANTFTGATCTPSGIVNASYNVSTTTYGNRVAVSGFSASFSNNSGNQNPYGGAFTPPVAATNQGRKVAIPTTEQVLTVGGVTAFDGVAAFITNTAGDINQISPVAVIEAGAVYSSSANWCDCLSRDKAIVVWEGPSPSYYLKAAAITLT